jgi:hypothetical protein
MSSCRFADGRAHLANGFNVSAFYEVLAEVMARRKTTWRLLARETEVPEGTLRRLAQGRCPNGAALATLSAWANLNPADFVVAAPNRMPTVAAIAAVLESDPNLERAAARDLETIIYVAYAGFRQHN